MSSEFGTFTAPFHASDSLLSVSHVTPDGTALSLARHGFQRAPERARVGRPAPLFEFRDLDGATKRLSDYRGHHVVVYFSATWCPTCAYQLDLLRALRQSIGPGRLAVLEISYDEDEQVLRSARQERWPNWSTSFTGRMEHENEIGWLYGADAAGIMYLVGPSGLFVGRFTTVEDLGRTLPDSRADGGG